MSSMNIVAQLEAKLGKLLTDVPGQVAKALYEEAQIEMKESMKRTPVEYGTLRASHRVTEPKIEGGEISVSIEVGGPAAPYAIYVHENLEAHHKVGQAKFLESTILESAPHMAARIAARVKLNGG